MISDTRKFTHPSRICLMISVNEGEMGGRGSGRQWRTVRGTTAECPQLDVRQLLKGGLLLPGRSFPYEWTRLGKNVASIHVTAYEDRVVLAYDHLSAATGRQGLRYCYSVLLEWLPCNFGGRRAWFRCPAIDCGCRVAVLYAERDLCVCLSLRHQLAYSSQRLPPYWRAVNRARAIRRRLGGTASLFEPFPIKPEGMHWKTYELLHHEYAKAKAASYPGWIVRRAEKELAKA